MISEAVSNQQAAGEQDRPQPVIVFEDVSKQYPGTASFAVDHVSLAVQPGELIVLLGPSGCGKTTLMKMVNRLIELTSGWIYINGTPIGDVPVNALRRSIGYVIQNVGLFPHMDVARNIAVVPEMVGWDKARIATRVEELLGLVGLPATEFAKRYPRQLSGGQQQRVGLARAMAANPAVMLMDEPFAAIDSITRRRLQDELIRIQRTVRKTILFVTHDVEEALRLADKIVVMREGQVVQYDTPLHLLSWPADDFVAQLVGADDVLRGLSLIDVGTIMQPLSQPLPAVSASGAGPNLQLHSNLRYALGLFLTSGAERIVVQDERGAAVGQISFAQVRHLSVGGHVGAEE